MKRFKSVVLLTVLSCVFLGSSFVVNAAEQKCPPHDFRMEMYSYSYTVEQSHTYLWGYVDGTIPLYKECTYKQTYIVLDEVCVDCRLDSGIDVVTLGGQSGHTCGR